MFFLKYSSTGGLGLIRQAQHYIFVILLQANIIIDDRIKKQIGKLIICACLLIASFVHATENTSIENGNVTKPVEEETTQDCTSNLFIQELQDRIQCDDSVGVAGCLGIGVVAGVTATMIAKPICTKLGSPELKQSILKYDQILEVENFIRIYNKLLADHIKTSREWYKVKDDVYQRWGNEFHDKFWKIRDSLHKLNKREFILGNDSLDRAIENYRAMQMKMAGNLIGEQVLEEAFENAMYYSKVDSADVYSKELHRLGESTAKLKSQMTAAHRDLRNRFAEYRPNAVSRLRAIGGLGAGIGFMVATNPQLILDGTERLRCADARRLSNEASYYVSFDIKCNMVISNEKVLELTLLDSDKRNKLLNNNDFLCKALIDRNKHIRSLQKADTPTVVPHYCSENKMIAKVNVNGRTYTHTYNIAADGKIALSTSFFPDEAGASQERKYQITVPINEAGEFTKIKTTAFDWHAQIPSDERRTPEYLISLHNEYRGLGRYLSSKDVANFGKGIIDEFTLECTVGEQLAASKRSFNQIESLCSHVLKKDFSRGHEQASVYTP